MLRPPLYDSTDPRYTLREDQHGMMMCGQGAVQRASAVMMSGAGVEA
jgi:hypothetical protein